MNKEEFRLLIFGIMFSITTLVTLFSFVHQLVGHQYIFSFWLGESITFGIFKLTIIIGSE